MKLKIQPEQKRALIYDNEDVLVAQIGMEFETELNRAWIYDENNEEIIGQTNFVVRDDYLEKIFQELFSEEYKGDLENFLDVYEPESEGELIYQRAKADGKIIEEGVEIYESGQD